MNWVIVTWLRGGAVGGEVALSHLLSLFFSFASLSLHLILDYTISIITTGILNVKNKANSKKEKDKNPEFT